MFKNFGLPSEEQWVKILKAIIFSFLSGFLATLTAQGGIQVGLGWEGFLSLIGGSMVAGFNGVLYMLYITFFEKSKQANSLTITML